MIILLPYYRNKGPKSKKALTSQFLLLPYTAFGALEVKLSSRTTKSQLCTWAN